MSSDARSGDKALDGSPRFQDDEFLCLDGAGALGLAGPVVYQGAVEALIANRCLACHGPGATAPELADYEAAFAAGAASAEQVASGAMPQGSVLSAADKSLFAAWASGGFLADAGASGNQEAPAAATTKSCVPTK